jgi:DNA ligase D-like protein (predicted 3'-phosphoesterase)
VSRIAIRATVPWALDHDAVVARARGLGVLGWVRVDDGTTRAHAEGDDGAVGEFATGLGVGARIERAKVEGHEQFAVRGVPAGAFVVSEHRATTRHFDLRLEVGGAMRSWALPKGPSMDPAVKRLAVEQPDHAIGGDVEGADRIIWDRGVYEQGGRVPWPEAIDRGHAVFVLHGEKLRGGFVLQRTPRGWLLVKRRDDHAQPGGDVVAERPGSGAGGYRRRP